MKLVFHPFAVADLPDPLEDDLIGFDQPALDDENVLILSLDGNQTLMHDVILTDHEYVLLVEKLEGRPLRDDEGVLQRPADQDGAGLAVAEQAVGVRKVGAEGDV